ncbi:VacJ family lipoprotein [Marinobacteraceae bacterium S3BR75-40.1]
MTIRTTSMASLALAFFIAGAAQAASTPKKNPDPWESFNRQIFQFNDTVDTYVAKPLAKGYRWITPSLVDQCITNFFSNIGEVTTLFNTAFQAKPDAFLTTTGRIVFNTTFGIAGLFDVATYMDLPAQNEDFGQTLGYWGLDTGPYIVLPFLGPSSVRDAGGLGVDYALPGPWDQVESPDVYYARGTEAIDRRADLIPAERGITGEKYSFVRNAYLQRREYLVKDGKVSDPFTSNDEDLMLEDF